MNLAGAEVPVAGLDMAATRVAPAGLVVAEDRGRVPVRWQAGFRVAVMSLHPAPADLEAPGRI